MKRHTSMMLCLAAVAAALATGTDARADFGIFGFTSAVVDPAGGSAGLPAGGSLVFTGNTGNSINGTLSGGADIIVGRVDYQPASTPTTSTPYSVDFKYTVTLTDVDSAASGDVEVTGSFAGTYIGGASAAINAQLLSSYAVNPTELTLGDAKYLVDIAQSSGPGSVTDPGVLRINVSAVPEPGSLALLGLGAVGLLGLRRARRSRVTS